MILFLRLKLHTARLAWPATVLLLLLQRTPLLRMLTNADMMSGGRVGQLLRAMIPTALALGATHTLTGQTRWTTNPATPVSGPEGTPLSVVFAFTGGSATPESYSIVGTLPPGMNVPNATGPAGNLTLNSTSGGSVTGTPTTAGNYNVTLIAFDGPNRTLGENGMSPSFDLAFTIQSNSAPPTFTTHPSTQTVNVGAIVTFTVTATGGPAPTLQWRKDTANLTGQTGSSLTINGVALGDAGSYDVVATNSQGTATSNAATLTVNAPPVFTTQPSSQSTGIGGSVTFTVAATGTPAPTLQWRKATANLPGETGTTLTLDPVAAGDAGSYTCVATNAAGSVTSNAAVLTIVAPPSIDSQPIAIRSLQGSGAFFAVQASGEELTYQWRRDNVDLPGETNSSLFISGVAADDVGDYSVRIDNPAGSIASAAVPLEMATTGRVRLINLSARALVGVGGDVLIPGFVVGGGGSKDVLIRAVGPKLADFGVPGVLADPAMQLFRGAVDAEANDDWEQFADQTLLEDTRAAVSAFPLSSANSLPRRDSAMVVSLAAGATNYTVKTVGVGDTTGVALVELFDADPPSTTARFVNISARAQVGTGGDVLIPGFFIEGDVAITLLIRAVGPTLGSAPYNVPGVLADPVMTLFRITNSPNAGDQEIMTTNDDWQQTPNLAAMEAARASTFAFPLNDGGADGALLVSLNPGGYTVKVEGKGGTTGVALMEIYLVGP